MAQAVALAVVGAAHLVVASPTDSIPFVRHRGTRPAVPIYPHSRTSNPAPITPPTDGVLARLPAPVPNPGSQLFRNLSWPSWGGTIVPGPPGDTSFHLFAASFRGANNTYCGLDGWECNGLVIHAVSNTGPAGPYAFAEVALPPYQHNPHVVLHPDGTYLMFGIGQANNASLTVPCKYAKPLGGCNGPIANCQLHTSRSPYGPWELVRNAVDGSDHIFVSNNANPAPYIYPNGSLVLLTCAMDLWYADHWSGPYTKIWTLPFHDMNEARNDTDQFCGKGCKAGETCRLRIEDPFIYFDTVGGVWRVLLHQYAGCFPTGARDWKTSKMHQLPPGDGSGLPYVGGYARSKTDDLFGEWVYDFTKPAYGAKVTYTNGMVRSLAGRERPKLYFENGKPSLLTNGVRFPPDPNQTDVFTFVQPVSKWYDDPDSVEMP